MASVTVDSNDFEDKIRNLTSREMECEALFEHVKKGDGEKSFQYVALRDSCVELRKDIFRTAMSLGLSHERIRQVMLEARNRTPCK